MVRSEIKNLLLSAVRKLYGDISIPKFSLESPENPEHGDYATNVAMVLAKILKKNPMEIASAIAEELRTKNLEFRTEVASPGFINFFLSAEVLYSELGEILKKKKKYGKLQIAKSAAQKINIEFVSANPTGPLTMANGRGGFYGDVLANVLEAYGHKVTREYYINDAGNQIKLLEESIAAAEGKLPPKDEYYRGDYINKLKGWSGKKAVVMILGWIGASLRKAEIKFDVWFSEDQKLRKAGEVKRVLEDFKGRSLLAKKDGAVWFGDRVFVKSNGDPTYLLVDITYQRNKLAGRKFDQAITVIGADHYAEAAQVRTGLTALGISENRFRAIIIQMVRLISGGKEVRMSKRKGAFIAIDELIDEVGLDAARYFFLERSPDTHMDFDLDLAKERSVKNPVYYIQYAHARIASIFKKALPSRHSEAEGRRISTRSFASLRMTTLREPEELILIKKLVQLPEIIEDTVNDYQVHRLTRYAYELARAFHNFYEKHRVITDDPKLSTARLALVKATQIVLQITLGLLGIKAPDRM
ncbi:MAG: arginine--tRNA ligase [Candidatus Sungbacteria bacterium]|nr:arginine--tRNA ligase [Candidatus Sungbacteria bacterium]